MCEECCDLSHHKDHNNQILLLKAAAQNFLSEVDFQLGKVVEQRVSIQKCEGFNLKNTIRKQIIDFFDTLKKQLEDMQRAKLDEFNKLFKDTNLINVKGKAKELGTRADLCEHFLASKRGEFDAKNYVGFLTQVQDVEKYVKMTEKIVKESSDLLKEQDS